MPLTTTSAPQIASYEVNVGSGVIALHINLIDTTDNSIIGSRFLTLPLDGVTAVQDNKGREIVPKTPTSTINAETALRADLQTRLDGAVAAGKLKL